MSSRRHGNKIVADITKAILFAFKTVNHLTIQQIVSELDDEYSELRIRKRVYSLRYQGLIAGDIKQDLILTDRGVWALEDLSFCQLIQHKKWDKKWRMVIFDIPEAKRPARDQIRRLLKDLGFLKLQISVWVHPLPCLEQFRIIRESKL